MGGLLLRLTTCASWITCLQAWRAKLPNSAIVFESQILGYKPSPVSREKSPKSVSNNEKIARLMGEEIRYY